MGKYDGIFYENKEETGEVKAGTALVFSSGEYSDYSFGEVYVAACDFNYIEQAKKFWFEEAEKEFQKKGRDFYVWVTSLEFESYLVKNGFLVLCQNQEIHTGDYGFFADDEWEKEFKRQKYLDSDKHKIEDEIRELIRTNFNCYIPNCDVECKDDDGNEIEYIRIEFPVFNSVTNKKKIIRTEFTFESDVSSKDMIDNFENFIKVALMVAHKPLEENDMWIRVKDKDNFDLYDAFYVYVDAIKIHKRAIVNGSGFESLSFGYRI